MTKKYEINLEPSAYYHVYNRAIGDANLFYRERNYLYFLKKYQEYISPVAETFAYCLMPNHFHFLIRVKTEEEIEKVSDVKKEFTGKNMNGSLFVSKQFSNFFNGYSQAINKQESRRGNLFMRPFKRKKIDSGDYLRNLVIYIHLNPVNHGYTKQVEDWAHCSYKSIIENVNKELRSTDVINWFEDLDNFAKVHKCTNKVMEIEVD